jgi:thymidine kinase
MIISSGNFNNNILIPMTTSSGKLELIIGNMFSGKSTELIRRYNREKTLQKKIMVVNYYLDSRYSLDDNIVTHDKNSIYGIKLTKLYTLLEPDILKKYDSFFIDEGQFFTDLYSVVSTLVDIHHKHVVVAGLDGDYNRKCFGELNSLIPICDTVDKYSAYCNKCNNGTYGPFTKKLLSNTGESVIEIGGKELYIPVCRYHYLN